MVPVMVTPDDCINGTAIDIYAILLQDRSYVLLDVDAPIEPHPFGILRKYLPVLSYAEIEQDRFARWMLDEKGETRTGQVWFTSVVRLEEWSHGNLEAACPFPTLLSYFQENVQR